MKLRCGPGKPGADWDSGIKAAYFLGVGTQKAERPLYRLLRRHPEVFIPRRRRFTTTKFYDRGDAWYREQFEPAPAGQLRGEITPYYLFHAAVPQRIHALRSDMKIIALLRHPVERTLSQYYHSCRWKLETLPLEEALAAEPQRLEGALEVIRKPGGTHLSYQEHSYLARSRYDEQLPRYFELFGRDRVLVLRSDDLFSGDRRAWRGSAVSEHPPFPDDTPIPAENKGAGKPHRCPKSAPTPEGTTGTHLCVAGSDPRHPLVIA